MTATALAVACRVTGAALGYRRRPVLRSVDLAIEAGSFLGILGPNGGGKTTLLRSLLGLLRPLAGRIEWAGGQPRIGYVRQGRRLDDLLPLTVREFVTTGRHGLMRRFRGATAADRAAVDGALAAAGMEDLAGVAVRELSGGQAQRCLLARALAAEPPVLALDEPTNDMDIGVEDQVLGVLRRVQNERHVTIVMVSHLLGLVLGAADQVALVSGGACQAGPAGEMLSESRLSEVFGLPLAVVEVGGRRAVVPLAAGRAWPPAVNS